MAEGLKPCPFCGAMVTEARNLDGEIHGIYCLRCKAMVRFTDIQPKKTDTFGKTEEEWTAKWNRRAESCKQS